MRGPVCGGGVLWQEGEDRGPELDFGEGGLEVEVKCAEA